MENPERITEALQWLTEELGCTREEQRELVVRFPHVLSFGVQVQLIKGMGI